jgi:SLIT-ROBO Rho GTPase activating protein
MKKLYKLIINFIIFKKFKIDLKSQLNEGSKCLEQRLDTQISILLELQDFFKKRAEVELQYSRDLDKLTKQIYARHKSEKSKYA